MCTAGPPIRQAYLGVAGFASAYSIMVSGILHQTPGFKTYCSGLFMGFLSQEAAKGAHSGPSGLDIEVFTQPVDVILHQILRDVGLAPQAP